MSEKLLSSLAKKLIDWLLVLLGVSIVLWFGVRMPVSTVKVSNDNDYFVSQNNIKKHVKKLTIDYAPRTIEYGNLNIVAHYIYNELNKFGTVSYQPYWTLGGRFSNIQMELGPDTKEAFVIGAHYDAATSSLDADGNASGVATLIELAKKLSEKKLPIKVIIVAYPLSLKNAISIENTGSYNHAAILSNSNQKIKLMVSLDGVGRFNSKDESQRYPYKFMHLFYPAKGDYVSLIGRLQDYAEVRRLKAVFNGTTSLSLYSFNLMGAHLFSTSSDHVNYQNKGFPAVLLTDTSEFRQVLSSSGEVHERLDYQNMAKLVDALHKVVMSSESEILNVRLAQHKVDFQIVK